MPFTSPLRAACVLLAALALPLSVAAQTDVEQALADSLVRASGGVFDDTLKPPTNPPAFTNESSRLITLRPGDWSPEFPVPFRRREQLGLQDSPPLLLSYDRADGLYLGIGANSPARMFKERRVQGHVGFGYAFGSHYWQVLGGFSVDFGPLSAPLRVGSEGHIITDTKDAWKMGVDENTAFALIAGIDNRDYFERNGFSVSARKYFSPRVAIGAEYRVDRYHNARREVGWSVFGPEQPFYEVPAITEGTMSSALVSLVFDYMALRSWDEVQFGLEAQAEFGSMDGNFEQYVVDARLKTTVIEERVWLALRGRLGSVTGAAPLQRLFTIGGAGTLPGFRQNEYQGNRMALLQSDVLIAPIRRLGLRVIVSNDFATIATTGESSGLMAGFLDDVSDIKYSPGIYLGSSTGAFRIGYAFRTDVFADPRFIVRVAQPF